MDGQQGYRHGPIIDPGAEALPDLLTRPMDALVAEWTEKHPLPNFWQNHVRRYAVTGKRVTRPNAFLLAACVVRNALPVSDTRVFGEGSRGFLTAWLMREGLLAISALMIIVLGTALLRTSLYDRQSMKRLRRMSAMYVLPLIGLWYGGKEALAALIRWHRLKKPLDRTVICERAFEEARMATVDALKQRLHRAMDDQGEDGTSPLATAAEALIRAYERAFDGYRQLCESSETNYAWAREALKRDYLLALQAVTSAEQGPTLVSATPAVAPAARDYSEIAFADTLVPGRHRVTRRPPP